MRGHSGRVITGTELCDDFVNVVIWYITSIILVGVERGVGLGELPNALLHGRIAN